jgi:hypothetical protein
MKAIVIYGLILAMVGFCRKENMNTDCFPTNIPLCIQAKIDEIKKEARWNPPAEVNEYLYNGKKVYLFTSDCCDQFITLVDATCNSVCAPSGGITGAGDGRCPDFYKEAMHLRLVWKDPR